MFPVPIALLKHFKSVAFNLFENESQTDCGCDNSHTHITL